MFKERDTFYGAICKVWGRNTVIFFWSSKSMIIDYFGINGTITCIVTLFLAEYCGFGWVVGTFFWVFCFCFGIAWTTKFKHWGGSLRREAAPAAPRFAFFRRDLRRFAAEWAPQCFNFVVQAIPKKNKISEKSPNYQPNPQYQPKTVTINIICEFCCLFIFKTVSII